EIFDRIQQSKKEQKKIKDMYKQSLENSEEYKRITEELKQFKEKKKQIENRVKNEFSQELEELERIKKSIADDQQLLSDVALNKVTKGESVEVTDEHSSQYEPVFTVKFRKAKFN
ncbi:MAG: hypothetical protein ACOCVY_02265, partial [Patescibacteria group bacterium]